MVVTGDAGQLYLLRHTAGDDAVAVVERIDPVSLATQAQSPELAGGPTWPGSVAAHANGSLYVVFGRHAHRLGTDLVPLARRRLPRGRPYNGFVILPDGCLATKDFAGSRPGHPVPAAARQPCELVVLEPDHLAIVARCTLPEPSVARLSADGADLYVVGDTSLLRVRWDGALAVDRDFSVPYRTRPGQAYGWDCVLADGGAWFLDDGDGSADFDRSLRGHGVATAPLHLHRVDLADGRRRSAEVCAEPGGLVANPPLVDVARGIVVGYDSAHAVLRGFSITGDALVPVWERRQEHGAHLLVFTGSGTLVTGDYDHHRGVDQVVLLHVATGDEQARVDTGSPLQSVLFPGVGPEGALYLCSLSTVTRVVGGPP
jgi:hypothetical protein